MKSTLFAIVLILSSSAVRAECWYNGYYYPTGTTIASFVCLEDGNWK